MQVRRIAPGERVDVSDGQGRRAEGVVARVDRSAKTPNLVLSIIDLAYDDEPAPRFVLVQALAKGDRDVAAVEAATELGVDAVVPWQAERSVVVWRPERAVKAQSRWAATVLAAAKQSRRSRVPDVASVVSTADLAQLVTDAALALVLHEDADRPLSAVPLPSGGDVLVVVGPEGGIGVGGAGPAGRRRGGRRTARVGRPAVVHRRAGRPRRPQRARPLGLTDDERRRVLAGEGAVSLLARLVGPEGVDAG